MQLATARLTPELVCPLVIETNIKGRTRNVGTKISLSGCSTFDDDPIEAMSHQHLFLYDVFVACTFIIIELYQTQPPPSVGPIVASSMSLLGGYNFSFFELLSLSNDS